MSKPVTILSEARTGTRVRLADDRVIFVTAKVHGDIFGRRVVGGCDGQLEWFSGSLPVSKVLS